MKYKLLFVILFSLVVANAQDSIIEWSPHYRLQLTDFESSETEINKDLKNISLYSGVLLDFSMQMSNIEFMFTKNFNAKVSCSFHRKAAYIAVQDSLQIPQLLKLVQFDFDLSELYARKIRKELHQNKKALSHSQFFRRSFDSLVSVRNKESAKVYKETDFGAKTHILEQRHASIKSRLNALNAYCKQCKSPKKQKRNRQ